MSKPANRRLSPGDIRLFPNKRDKQRLFWQRYFPPLKTPFRGTLPNYRSRSFFFPAHDRFARPLIQSVFKVKREKISRELFILPCKLELISDEIKILHVLRWSPSITIFSRKILEMPPQNTSANEGVIADDEVLSQKSSVSKV
jgi:hypothetical protein